MSAPIDAPLPLDRFRPTPRGRARHPFDRATEVRRPTAVYRLGIQVSLAHMVVIDRLRAGGFRR